jgi:DNA-binding IclR family transcriptional regulator
MELNNKDEKKSQGTPILKSVDKSFKLLDCFLGEKNEYTLNELARKLCISKGTVHRILLTAQKRGMIEHNEDTGKYQLGTKIFQLGNVVAKRMNLRRECLPYLKNISQQTGETSFLIVKDGDGALCVECVEGNNMLRYQFLDVGKKMPLHVGAGPRVLLAHMDDAYIDKWLKKNKLMP